MIIILIPIPMILIIILLLIIIIIMINTNHYYLRGSSEINSVVGPVLFNLKVNDLSSALPSEVVCHQYADDTTKYTHFRPSDFEVGQSVIQDALNKLSDWSLERNLALNPRKQR